MLGYLEDIKTILNDITGADFPWLDMDAPLDQVPGLSVDDYTLMLIRLEEKYNIEIDVDELESLHDFGDLCLLIVSKTA
ncbi:MAG: hypothetical protein CVU05_09300 [Bacteroidetes bacterium HGW-Bacteroidetes-21]|jgi:acyl carrier protein|nr:MAG: hypothetical protein CVU05_09300 [Bacteroidetes bacterium HGW-Bacteroidetes-21]